MATKHMSLFQQPARRTQFNLDANAMLLCRPKNGLWNKKQPISVLGSGWHQIRGMGKNSKDPQ
jgi:hypothetical protein